MIIEKFQLTECKIALLFIYVKCAIFSPMELNLAVLIDGDNIPSAHVKEMMEEIAKYGIPTIKRIYGDWTNPKLSKWKKILLLKLRKNLYLIV